MTVWNWLFAKQGDWQSSWHWQQQCWRLETKRDQGTGGKKWLVILKSMIYRIDKDNWDWDALLRIHIVCISDQFQWSPFQLSSQEGCSYSERVISSFLQREDDFLLPKQEILRLSPSKMSQFYWFQILRLSLDVAPGSTVALVSHTFLLSPSFPVSIVSWHLCARWDLKTQISTIDGVFILQVGPSGCGKSTCIQLVQRLYDPEAGTVFIFYFFLFFYPNA